MDISFLKKLAKENDIEFNLIKLTEELSELSVETVSWFTKPKGRTSREIAITKELGDVIIRIEMLKECIDKNLLTKHINRKIAIMKVNTKKYKNV